MAYSAAYHNQESWNTPIESVPGAVVSANAFQVLFHPTGLQEAKAADQAEMEPVNAALSAAAADVASANAALAAAQGAIQNAEATAKEVEIKVGDQIAAGEIDIMQGGGQIAAAVAAIAGAKRAALSTEKSLYLAQAIHVRAQAQVLCKQLEIAQARARRHWQLADMFLDQLRTIDGIAFVHCQALPCGIDEAITAMQVDSFERTAASLEERAKKLVA